jgi:hypothetical protein
MSARTLAETHHHTPSGSDRGNKDFVLSPFLLSPIFTLCPPLVIIEQFGHTGFVWLKYPLALIVLIQT